MTAEHVGAGFHRAFPFVVGLGVMAALLLLRVLPPPRAIAFFALPVLAAALLGALVATRDPRGRIRWFAAKHGAVAAVAAAATVVLALGIGFFGPSLWFLKGVDPEIVELTIFAGSMGVVAGWFAGHLERGIDRGDGRPAAARTLRNPKSWGVPGVAGVSIFLASLLIFASILASLSAGGGSGPGPVVAGFYTLIAVIVGILSAVVGLVLEAVACRRNARRSAKVPGA